MINKLKILFTHNELIQSINLIVFLIIVLIFEVFGIAIFIPVFSILLEQDIDSSNIIIKSINDFFVRMGLLESKLFLLIIITSTFFLKTIVQTLIIYKQKKTVTNIIRDLSNRMFTKYLNQPYIYYTKVNRSRIVQFLQTEILFLFNYFEALLSLVAEVIIFFGIYLLIFLIEPLGVIFLTIAYMISGYVYYYFSTGRLNNWGIIRLNIDQYLSKLILESIGNIKNIILSNLKNKFSNYFISKNATKAKYTAYQLTVNQLPRIYFEFITIISIVSFLFFAIFQEENSSSAFFILAIFGLASFKLLPSINKIFTYFQQINYYSSSFNKIADELKNLNEPLKNISNYQMFSFRHSITISDVSFSYEKNKILEKVNLNIKKGTIVGIIGESGAGKSTLINLITGLYQPIEGKIKVDNIDIRECLYEYQSKLAYVSQSVILFDESIKKNVAFELEEKLIDVDKVNSCLKEVELDKWVLNLENGLDTIVGEQGLQISGGQKQRLGIANALYKDPDILIFDEATSSLDDRTETKIMNLISRFKNNKTIIIISHKAEKLKFCDEIYQVSNSNLSISKF